MKEYSVFGFYRCFSVFFFITLCIVGTRSKIFGAKTVLEQTPLFTEIVSVKNFILKSDFGFEEPFLHFRGKLYFVKCNKL